MYLLQNYAAFKSFINKFFQKCINFEVSIGNKICRFIQLYRTSSQSQDEFQDDFLTNLEMNLDGSFNSNPFLTTHIGDSTSMLHQTNGQRVIGQPSKRVKLIFLLLSLNSLK